MTAKARPWGKGPRSCEGCGAVFIPARKGQRSCGVACRGKSQERDRVSEGRATSRDHCAPAMVRGWNPAQRERIRRLLTEPWWAGPAETALVGIIDQVNAEERC